MVVGRSEKDARALRTGLLYLLDDQSIQIDRFWFDFYRQEFIDKFLIVNPIPLYSFLHRREPLVDVVIL